MWNRQLLKNKIGKEFKYPGIYIIEIERHKYIGSSKNIQKRLPQHRRCLRSNKKDNLKFINVYNKYGSDRVFCAILEICPENSTINYLRKREEYWIQKLNPDLNVCKTPTTQGKPEPNFNNTSSKKVYQYSLEGDFIAEYESASEAARRIGCNSKSISSAASEKSINSKSIFGFQWSYIKVNQMLKYENFSKDAKIVEIDCFDLNSFEYKKFRSIADAVRTLNPNCKNFDAECATISSNAKRRAGIYLNKYIFKKSKDEKFSLNFRCKTLIDLNTNKIYKDSKVACKELNLTSWELKKLSNIVKLTTAARVKFRESGKLQYWTTLIQGI